MADVVKRAREWLAEDGSTGGRYSEIVRDLVAECERLRRHVDRSETEARLALRALVRGYLVDPNEGYVQSLHVTSVAWIHVRDVLHRLDPTDPRCRYCGDPVDEPGQVHAGGCGKVG